MQDSNVGKTPPKNFGRKLSGKLIIVFMVLLLIIVVALTALIGNIRFNMFLSSIEPRESFNLIVKDLREFEKNRKNFPETLDELGKEKTWTLNDGLGPVNTRDGVTIKSSDNSVSRLRYRNYEYLYSRLANESGEPIAVLWAVPRIGAIEKPRTLEYGFNDTDITNEIAEWKRTKSVFYVIVTPSKTLVWDNPQPDLTTGTMLLNRFLEPDSEQLQNMGLKQNFAAFGKN